MNYAWDDTCEFGKLGCKADGRNVKCRFCGTKPYPACPLLTTITSTTTLTRTSTSTLTRTSTSALSRTSTPTTAMLAHDIPQTSGANALDNGAAKVTTSLRNGNQ